MVLPSLLSLLLPHSWRILVLIVIMGVLCLIAILGPFRIIALGILLIAGISVPLVTTVFLIVLGLIARAALIISVVLTAITFRSRLVLYLLISALTAIVCHLVKDRRVSGFAYLSKVWNKTGRLFELY